MIAPRYEIPHLIIQTKILRNKRKFAETRKQKKNWYGGIRTGNRPIHQIISASIKPKGGFGLFLYIDFIY
ncbi:hypothetical protein HanRHA438_Chr05g0202771 [Helianthus annuus]|uniref:Uncharacterized protein n=1 Tax=Helianthus annuus TaxID=4232 RepID=A0A251ULV5_HELAN|nr:hypothetical protein HanXRQr2_Chr05g0193001 [Helianthus annuus]KAJ0583027.1 hypothetical protein HanHA89_Chr05g0172041 [Helianthus annuus]KAJ0917144.1 hypothetical protein HanRHA438_Chr05g0202771 [Helianthus annuus]